MCPHEAYFISLLNSSSNPGNLQINCRGLRPAIATNRLMVTENAFLIRRDKTSSLNTCSEAQPFTSVMMSNTRILVGTLYKECLLVAFSRDCQNEVYKIHKT